MSNFLSGAQIALSAYKFVLRNRILLVFPLISSVCFILSTYLLYKWEIYGKVLSYEYNAEGQITFITIPKDNYTLLRFFIGYYLFIFLTVFSNVVTVRIIYSYYKSNENFSMIEGIKFSFSRIVPIAIWALVTACFGIILKILESIERKLGRSFTLISWMLEMAWGVATFFVVPVICFNPSINPFTLIKRSSAAIIPFGEAKNIQTIAGFEVIHFLGFAGIASLFSLKEKIPDGTNSFLWILGSLILYILFLYFVTTIRHIVMTIYYIYSVEHKLLNGIDIDENTLHQGIIRKSPGL